MAGTENEQAKSVGRTFAVVSLLSNIAAVIFLQHRALAHHSSCSMGHLEMLLRLYPMLWFLLNLRPAKFKSGTVRK